MAGGDRSRNWRRRAAIAAGAAFAGLLTGYLALVWLGGGWAARHDEKVAREAGSMLLFAHRGVSAEGVPENTQAAFEAARRAGFRGIELDVRKTRDNELAVFHDPVAYTLGLKTNFNDLTLTDIQGRPIFSGSRRSTNTVPALREVFSNYGGTFLFYIDMKEKAFGEAHRLARLIEEHGLEERTIVASVDPLFLAFLEHHYPRINTALERFDAAQVWTYRLIPRRWKPDFLSGFARKVTPAHLGWLRRKNLLPQRIVYEVNAGNYEQVVGSGITLAIVDYSRGAYAEALKPTEDQSNGSE